MNDRANIRIQDICFEMNDKVHRGKFQTQNFDSNIVLNIYLS